MQTTDLRTIVVPLSQETFSGEVATGFTVIAFWASWHAPSRRLAREFANAARLRPDFRFGKVNIDTEPALATEFQIRSVPTVMVFRDGQALVSDLGHFSAAELVHELDRIAAGEGLAQAG